MRSRLQQQLVVGAFLATAAFIAAQPAWGAPSVWDDISVTLHGLGSPTGPVLIVRGTLDSSVSLPTVAELPVPCGVKLSWVGEVRGGNPMNDPVASFEARSAKDCDVLGIDTQHSRTVQAEMEPPDGWLTVGPEGTLVTMEWTALKPVDHVRLAFKVEGDMHAERLRPRSADKLHAGDETVYAIDADSVRAGESLTLTALVVRGAESATDTVRQSASGSEPELGGTPHKTAPLVLAIAALAAAAVVVALVFALRKSRAEQAGPHDTST